MLILRGAFLSFDLRPSRLLRVRDSLAPSGGHPSPSTSRSPGISTYQTPQCLCSFVQTAEFFLQSSTLFFYFRQNLGKIHVCVPLLGRDRPRKRPIVASGRIRRSGLEGLRRGPRRRNSILQVQKALQPQRQCYREFLPGQDLALRFEVC